LCPKQKTRITNGQQNTTQTTNDWAKRTPLITRGTHVLLVNKQFLLGYWHPSCWTIT
jgi:hypothetical protein